MDKICKTDKRQIKVLIRKAFIVPQKLMNSVTSITGIKSRTPKSFALPKYGRQESIAWFLERWDAGRKCLHAEGVHYTLKKHIPLISNLRSPFVAW